MDGRNSAGRKISLLNDSSDVAACGIPPSVSINTSSIANTSIANTTTSSTSSTSSKFQLPPLSAHLHQHQQQRFVHGHPRPALHHAHASSSHSHHSHDSSSRSTSPCLSPQTPVLSRSSSSDSRAYQTPSPVTPSFEPSFTSSKHHSAGPHLRYPHHHHQHSQSQHHRQQYFLLNNSSSTKMDDPSLYPPLPDLAAAQAPGFGLTPTLTPQMPALPMQQSAHRSSNSPGSEPSRVSTVSAASNSKAQPKKNQYPCPLAKQYNCSDFFTTSGHAARHAKKHTGKKDAFCPECNKAFTRKDNMEQHRRTHQNGRGASRSSTGTTEDSKVKKPAKPTKKTVTKSEPQLEAAVQQELADQQAAQAQAQAVAAQVQAQVAQVQASQAQTTQTNPTLTAQPLIEPIMMMPPAGPYFLGGLDPGPVPALPMAMPDLTLGRPPLHRTTLSNNLDFIAPAASLISDDALHYSYPSPGLSNGLNSLALAASEHRRRLSEEEKPQSQSSQSPAETPLEETPSQETP